MSGIAGQVISGRTWTDTAVTPPRLRECHDCGQFQVVPALRPATRAHCLRCDATLRHTHRDPLRTPLALNLAALVLFLIGAGSTLMKVSSAGQVHIADLFSGPLSLERDGLWELAVVVLFTTAAAPLAKVTCMLYVLIGLGLPHPPRHIRTVFAWVEHLRPWSMVEVYMLGVFVAYAKLGALVQIEVGIGIFALAALILTMIAADVTLDPQFVWEEMERRGIPDASMDHAAIAVAPSEGVMTGCETCGMVSPLIAAHADCPRCGFRLHWRKPNSITRTWALALAGAILYVPANVYPVLTVIQLGAGAPSTILGGVRELLAGGQWPLAALVFLASITVPVLKLIGLTVLLVTTQARSSFRRRDRTRLYRIVDVIGRWSMIDIFMISILVALVRFGSVVTINPGAGAIAFASVVILTMFAARAFDPRLIWDAADTRRA